MTRPLFKHLALRPFGADRLEPAATRAIEIGTLTYGSVRSILDNKLDREAAQRPSTNGMPIFTPNIRGPRYYHCGELSLLTHPMLDQLGELILSGMAQAFAELEAS